MPTPPTNSMLSHSTTSFTSFKLEWWNLHCSRIQSDKPPFHLASWNKAWQDFKKSNLKDHHFKQDSIKTKQKKNYVTFYTAFYFISSFPRWRLTYVFDRPYTPRTRHVFFFYKIRKLVDVIIERWVNHLIFYATFNLTVYRCWLKRIRFIFFHKSIPYSINS